MEIHQNRVDHKPMDNPIPPAIFSINDEEKFAYDQDRTEAFQDRVKNGGVLLWCLVCARRMCKRSFMEEIILKDFENYLLLPSHM